MPVQVQPGRGGSVLQLASAAFSRLRRGLRGASVSSSGWSVRPQGDSVGLEARSRASRQTHAGVLQRTFCLDAEPFLGVDVAPELLDVVPVLNDTVLHGVLDVEEATVLLCRL